MDKNNVGLKVAVGVLIGLVVILIFKVNALQDSIQGCNNNNPNNNQDYLVNSIQSVEASIEDLKEEVLYGSSIISSCDAEIVGVNGDNNTAKVKIGIIPKEASEEASLTVIVGKKTIPLKNDVNDSSDCYYGTIEIPIEGLNNIDKCPDVSVSIDDDNITSEDIKDRLQDDFFDISDVILGKNEATFSGDYSVKDGKVTFNGTVNYSLGNLFVDKTKKACVMVLMENKEEWSKELTDVEGQYDIQQYFDFQENASGSLVVEIQGESGLKYRYHLVDFNDGDSTESNLYVSDCWIEICDKDGKTLY